MAWLGYGGLLPFLFLAIATWVDLGRALFWNQALVAYGAVILSFVGALHWGFAMSLNDLGATRRQTVFVWSVMPALLAWLALLLAPLAASCLLVAGFVAHYVQDLRLGRHASLPAWYRPLRLQLTSVAGVCLAAGALAVLR